MIYEINMMSCNDINYDFTLLIRIFITIIIKYIGSNFFLKINI